MSENEREDETPTSPELPSYRCPECHGKGTPGCPECSGAGMVNRHQLAEWHATRQGRPPANPGSR